VLLSMVVIIGWQLLFPPPEPAPGPGAESRGAEDVAAGGPEEGAEPEVGSAAASTAERMDRDAPGAPGETARGETPSEPVGAEREERVELESGAYRAVLSNRGGVLVSLELAEYEDPEGGPVELVRDRRNAPYPFDLVDGGGRPLAVGDALFAVDEGLTEDGYPTVAFRYGGAQGRVTKRFTALPDGLIEVAVEARGVGPWGLVMGPGLRNPSARDAERRFKYRGAVYRSGDDVETLDSEKVSEEAVISGAGLEWIGLEDTYFLTAVIPRSPVDRAVVRPYLVEPAEDGAPNLDRLPGGELSGEREELRHELQVAVMPQGESFEGVAYLGAKDLERLSSFPWRLQETVRLGMFGILARPFLIGLKWIYENVVANYGWAIVLMTMLIKLVLLPLTHKSYVSMQKMQELAPQIKAIRNKYQGKLRDKKGRPDIEQQRKMNEEIQGLYRSEGVNPAGGCLPILLQFPVLIAFYRLLSNAVELRDAPWILWIEDLSLHDPIYVLPVVMGAVQFLQQRMAPSSAEPMQRRMMMAMPVVFTFLFLGFPSGLVLYWLTNNVLTVIQQWVYQRWKARQAAKA
jgi:YidC/Oxa1 family membrane protein insertase